MAPLRLELRAKPTIVAHRPGNSLRFITIEPQIDQLGARGGRKPIGNVSGLCEHHGISKSTHLYRSPFWVIANLPKIFRTVSSLGTRALILSALQNNSCLRPR